MSPVLAHTAAMTAADAAAVAAPLAALLLAGSLTARRLPAGLAWATAVAALFGAQYIHWSVVDSHWDEWVPAGLFFVVTALAEGLLAVGLVVSRSRRLAALAVALNVMTVAVWAVSRTVGLPIGPGAGRPETLGRGDYIATLLELAAVFALRPFLASDGPAPPPLPETRRAAATGASRQLPLIAAMAVYVVGVTAYGLAAADQHAAGGQIPSGDDARLVAARLHFDAGTLTLPASRPVRVRLTNDDGAPHNLAIYGSSSRPLFRGPLAEPNTSRVYAFASPAPGAYTFHCDVHPGMAGTLTVR